MQDWLNKNFAEPRPPVKKKAKYKALQGNIQQNLFWLDEAGFSSDSKEDEVDEIIRSVEEQVEVDMAHKVLESCSQQAVKQKKGVRVIQPKPGRSVKQYRKFDGDSEATDRIIEN